MSANDIVGHKTFDAGEIDPETGFPKLRHEPLTRSEADRILFTVKEAERARAVLMPDEKSAVDALFQAWLRLKELGWREACYCPKDGSEFIVIEAGITGMHACHYQGDWPTGTYWISDGGDIWPSLPILFKLSPEAEEAEKARLKAAGERYKRAGGA